MDGDNVKLPQRTTHQPNKLALDFHKKSLDYSYRQSFQILTVQSSVEDYRKLG